METSRSPSIAATVSRNSSCRRSSGWSSWPETPSTPPCAGPAASGPRVEAVPSPFPQEPRVLVVDDSVVVRQVLSLTLRQLPEFLYAHIDQASNGAIALRKMTAGRYDLVLSDIRMPLVDGLEFVRRVRRDLGDR